MYHICIIYVSYMYHICITYVSYMYHICIIYVSYMYHICIIYVSYMYHICIIYVSYMYHICITLKILIYPMLDRRPTWPPVARQLAKEADGTAAKPSCAWSANFRCSSLHSGHSLLCNYSKELGPRNLMDFLCPVRSTMFF